MATITIHHEVNPQSAQATSVEADQITDLAASGESKTPSVAELLGAAVIEIPGPEWPAPAGTIEHLHKILSNDIRLTQIYLDPKCKFMKRNQIPSEDIYIMRIEGNVYTFQSGPDPTRYKLSAREECIAGYAYKGTRYWLDKKSGLYKPNGSN